MKRQIKANSKMTPATIKSGTKLAYMIEKVMPKDHGFALLMFEWNGPDISYISNGERPLIMRAMRDFISSHTARPKGKSELVQQLEFRIAEAEDRSWDRQLLDAARHINTLADELKSAELQYVERDYGALRATLSRMLIAVVSGIDALDGP